MTSSGLYWAVVPAAGQGSRMGKQRPKQYLQLGRQSILDHTLSRLIDMHVFHRIVVAVQSNDNYWPVSEFATHPLICSVAGGKERADSVLNGLDAIADIAASDDWVLVHDAARPCVSRMDIHNLIDAVNDHPVGGILARPISDTVKTVEQSSILGTVDRRQLWCALTPQMFRFGLLRQALQQAEGPITDESSAIEAMGLHPIVVRGSAQNIKVTEPDDLALATIFLQQQDSD